MASLAVHSIGALTVLGLMIAAWIASLAPQNSSIADIFWGLGFVVTNRVYSRLRPAASGPYSAPSSW